MSIPLSPITPGTANPNAALRTSFNGMCAIIQEEAIVLRTYPDTKKVPTIGVGHTAAAGGIIPTPGLTITLLQAVQQFQKDLVRFETHVKNAIKFKLLQYQFDALVSFDFNTGAIQSGSVDDFINAKKLGPAMDVLMHYEKAGGVVLQDLVHRRTHERDMFEHGVYPAVPYLQVFDSYPGKGKLVSVNTIRSQFN